MKVVDSSQMERIDARAREEYGIPQDLLMENAGAGALQALKRFIWKGRWPHRPIVFLVGKGNNGGDALVMARHCFLQGKRDLALILAGGEPKANSAPGENLRRCRALGIETVEFPREEDRVPAFLAGAGWIVDGLFGTGLRGAVREPLDRLIEVANHARGRIASIDVPSGLGDAFRPGYPCISATVTLTVEVPKRCLYLPAARLQCGRILAVRHIFPQALVDDAALPGEMLKPAALRREYPSLPADTYKNQRGHLAVFAGSPGTTGAAWLASTAAARCRAGLVTLFAEREAYSALAPRCRSVMARPWDGGGEPGALDLSGFDALLVGPGWGTQEERVRWLEHFLKGPLPGVLDADGLGILGRLLAREKRAVDLQGRWILTPHPGEFARLAGIDREEALNDPVGCSLHLSLRLKAVVVLKGHVTVIASPSGRYWIHDGMNPALATGGSGDVLAGILGGLLAGGIGPETAARLGVLLHARTARKTCAQKGYFLAEDLLPFLSRVVKEVEDGAIL